MAICRDCDQDMLTAASCTITTLTLGANSYRRKPFGAEPGWPTKQPRCGDCGVHRDGHHHLGCDIARCPACGGQLLSCGCMFREYGNDELFWGQVEEASFEAGEIADWGPANDWTDWATDETR